MAAPPKPWERGGGQNRGPFFVSADTGRTPINQHSTTSLPQSGSSTVPSINRAPPPLPTRQSQQGSMFNSVNRYGGLESGYGNGYSGYGSGMGGYGGGYGSGYGSSYGSGYGSMYGGFNGGGGMHGGGMYGGGGHFGQSQFGSGTGFNQFLQRAEENSRPAFQSIESIVQAFSSISMMMESTLQTVYNSFRAVLGVADHFSRLKVHLAHVFTALALFRTLRYLYRRILVFLGLRNREFAEELWEKAQGGEAGLSGELEKFGSEKKRNAPSWPIFMFLAVVVGGPYIIWKLLCSTENEQDQPGWASGEDDHVVARSEFDFDAEGNNELSFKAGVMMNLAPKELQPKVRGWVLASVTGQTTGLVPANYIKILGRRRGQKRNMDETKELASKQENVADTTLQASGSQSGVPSLQATHSETNLEAFDKAFAEAPETSRPAEGGMQASLDSQWVEWEKEGTTVEIGNMNEQMVESDKADEISNANDQKS